MEIDLDIIETDLDDKVCIEKKRKLLHILNKTQNDPRFQMILKKIIRKLNLTESDIRENFVSYNIDVEKISNQKYLDLSNRYVLHIHNLIEGSWHQEKQEIILDYFTRQEKGNMIEVGFGVPSKYIRNLVLDQNKFHLTLCDLSEAAFTFSKVLLSEWSPSPRWQEYITFKKADMNEHEYLGDYDIYLFQDCIEHTYDPTQYLTKQVQLSPPDAKFVLILAIGPSIPMHYISWQSEHDAVIWLQNCGLKIEKSQIIYTNPEIDLFSSDKMKFQFVFFACSKS